MKAWEEFLEKQEKRIGTENVKRWLKTLKVIKFDACNLYLEAENQFHKNWIDEHISQELLTLTNNNGNHIKVHLNTDLNKKNLPVAPKGFKEDNLDPFFSLDNFFFSEENTLALSLIGELTGYNFKEKKAETPSLEPVVFNPILLWGPSGCGKTHLLHATAKTLKMKNENVFFIDAATFTEYIVNAIRFGTMLELRKILREIEVLIVDNIHVLANKSATQEEFFHTFNSLHLSKKQIILSSTLPPKEMHDIEKRLVSRFEWGITLPLTPPTKEISALIFKDKLNEFSLKIPSDGQKFLLEKFDQLPSLLKAVQALAIRNNGATLNEGNISLLLKDLLLEEDERKISTEKIIATVASHFKLRPEEITGKAQNQECSNARKVAIYLCRTILSMPYVKIGKIFGRDHSTIMTSFGQVEKALKENDTIASSCYLILRELQTRR